ncbi:TPA: hypothetical protein ACHJYD_001956 [Enterococcus faecalis]
MKNESLIRSGYWSIATQKHLKVYASDTTHLDEFDNINTSGKAGRLMGVIRGNSSINSLKKLEKMGQSIGIQKNELHKIVLPEIEKASDGVVEVKRDVTGQIIHIEEYIYSQETILEIAGKLLENQNPTSIERITIETLNETKKAPLLEDELFQFLSKLGFLENDIALSTNLQAYFNLVKKLENSLRDPIYSNEYVWGSNHEKIAHAFSSLDIGKKEEIKSLTSLLQDKQGYPLEKLNSINKDVINLSKHIGMITPTTIVSTRGIEREFGFSANLLSDTPYCDDIMDDVKLLLASIRFGEHYTPYSTINSPERFLSYLISQKKIGPHSANGTDFFMLEKRGIVKVTPSNISGRYFLELIREDVAKEALKIVSSPNFNINIDPSPSDLGALLNNGDFLSPEESRIKLGKPSPNVAEAMDHLTRVLRDETL